MKVVYNIPSVVARAGMERVLANKANYLADKTGTEVVIVTTDQKGRPPVFPFSSKVRFADLGINYSDKKNKYFLAKIFYKRQCKRKHRKALEKFLLEEQPDITISMMLGKEKEWLPGLKEPSKKILEFHFSKPSLIPRSRLSFGHWIKYRKSLKAIQAYHKFVVLTEEDKSLWHEIRHVAAIPNALTFFPPEQASLTIPRVLAVGRLAPQKGFDRLIDIWSAVHPVCPEWKLSIIGEGPDKIKLEKQIRSLGLESSVEILPTRPEIINEYMQSSVFVLTSRFEDMVMVMLEAMACGLPAVSYACPCGPKDIIRNNNDGFLIEDGNRQQFADKLILLMQNEALRKEMGENARQNISRYREDRVMEQWETLFSSLAGRK